MYCSDPKLSLEPNSDYVFDICVGVELSRNCGVLSLILNQVFGSWVVSLFVWVVQVGVRVKVVTGVQILRLIRNKICGQH